MFFINKMDFSDQNEDAISFIMIILKITCTQYTFEYNFGNVSNFFM